MKRSALLRRRSTLKRSGYLRGKKPLQRTTRIRSVNSKRRRRRYLRDFGPWAAVVRTMPCYTCDALPPSDPSHIQSRGSGRGARANLVPMCRRCHKKYEAGKKTFQQKRGIDLLVIAKGLWETRRLTGEG